MGQVSQFEIFYCSCALSSELNYVCYTGLSITYLFVIF